MLVNKTLLKSARAVQFTNIRHKGKLPTLEEIARIKDKVLKLDLAYLEPEFNKTFLAIHGQTGSDPFAGLRSSVPHQMAFAEGEGLDTRYVPASSLLLRSTDNTTKTLFKSTLRVYKMFLVVKSIELLASRDLPPPSPHDNYVDWGTPCNAPHIVDLMWHSHVLHTRRYAEETKGIAGQVVHHNPGYWCPKEKREQANFLRKVHEVFNFQLSRYSSDTDS
ncbi:hypothetical protein TrRE_jg5820, partial [Triparma retinervis]